MKRKKYGEDTVVIRVPASRKEEILKLLERYEVIDDLTQLKTDNPLHDAFMKGYMHCYNKWEEYNGVLQFVLMDNASFVPEYLDMVRGKLPQSVHDTVFQKMTNAFFNFSKSRKADNVFQQIELINSFVDDALINVARIDFVPSIFSDSATKQLKQPDSNEK